MKLKIYVILSLAGYLMLIAMGFVCALERDLFLFASEMSFPVACMIFYPLSYEKKNYSLYLSGALLCVCIASMLLKSVRCIPLCVLVACIVDSVFRFFHKYSKIRVLFRNSEIWHNVEEYSRMIVELLFFLLVFLIMLANTFEGTLSDVMLLVLMLLLAIMYIVVCVSRSNDRLYLIGRKKEKLLRTLSGASLKDPGNIEESENNRRMNILYKRIVDRMNEQKPYLDETFNLVDFAKSLYTNKVYLSRTINACSGRNFKQFTNYFRVRYSIELMKKDPVLRVDEVALMSGFHTVVSYNMAFKLFMDETPSEWARRYKRSLKNTFPA